MARILFITTKQPSTNPRMRKSADALGGSGHAVHVLYAYNTDWATRSDEDILNTSKWTHACIGGSPTTEKLRFLHSRISRKCAEWVGMDTKAICRGFSSYVREGIRWKPDLVIGHNPGALAVIVSIAEKLDIPALFDAEDFHRGELPSMDPRSLRIEKIEDEFVPRLSALTTASPLISEAYQELYPQTTIQTVNNAFPLDFQPSLPTEPVAGPLRICWFSQVVGTDRGLEDFIAGMNRVMDIQIEFSIIGTCSETTKSKIVASNASTIHSISFHPPMPEADLFRFVGNHEIGLALEVPATVNRDLCRTNKLYVYPLAGLFMLLSETKAQREFLEEFPQLGELIDLKSPTSIAAAIKEVANDRQELKGKRELAWTRARQSLNWEIESAALTKCVQKLIQ